MSTNPLFGFKALQPTSRVVLVTPEEHAAMVRECQKLVVPKDNTRKPRRKHPHLGTYLIASRCGARPRQIREVRRANVTADCTAWTFEDHKTRHKTRKPLVVYLSPCLQTLTRIAMSSGRDLRFTNSRRTPWQKDGVCEAMKRLCKRIGPI